MNPTPHVPSVVYEITHERSIVEVLRLLAYSPPDVVVRVPNAPCGIGDKYKLVLGVVSTLSHKRTRKICGTTCHGRVPTLPRNGALHCTLIIHLGTPPLELLELYCFQEMSATLKPGNLLIRRIPVKRSPFYFVCYSRGVRWAFVVCTNMNQ